MKLEFSPTDFRKALKCRISWKSVQWGPSCSTRVGGRTDRQTDDEDNSSFSQFWERAYKCYAKNKTTNKTQTRSSLTHLFLTYPFPILRSLSSHSTITNLHIFLSPC